MFANTTCSRQVANLLLLPLLWIGVASLVEAQTSSSYLDALAGEAEDLAVDNKTRARSPASSRVPLTSADQVGSPGQAVGDLVPDLTPDQFEQALKRNYIGSYLFYSRLSTASKDEVFEAYQADPSPDAVRAKILSISRR